jgi:hypothetical protein
MSSGISLEQLRAQLDSEAQKKCVALELANKQYVKIVNELIEANRILMIDLGQLQNRCWIQCRGLFCRCCTFQFSCIANNDNVKNTLVKQAEKYVADMDAIKKEKEAT